MVLSERAEPSDSDVLPAIELDVSTSRRPRLRGRVMIAVYQVVFLAVILGTWQLLTSTRALSATFASEPSAIAVALYHGFAQGTIPQEMKTTLFETLIGFLISAVAGILSALALFSWPTAQQVLAPFISGFNSLPRLALTPLFVIWFGIGSASKIALAVTFTYFVVLLNTYAGLKSVPRDYLVLARALGVRRTQLFWHFMLPSAAPSIFTGLELDLVYSFLAAVVGEMVSGGSGIGNAVAVAQASFDTALVFADLLVMGLAATILAAIMRSIEHKALAWHRYELRGTHIG